MVQNVFTFTHPLTGKTQGIEFDFNEAIHQLSNEGWSVKQISTSTYTQSNAPFIAVTVLAEKVK